METAKVRVKFGNLEVEYEGQHDFVQDGLLELISDVVNLSSQMPSAPALPDSGEKKSFVASRTHGHGALTISTIAAHLTPDGPQELMMCALAKLQIVDGKDKVERKEIRDEIKLATTYYRASMGTNLPRDLDRMVKGKKINELSNGVYSLTAASRQDLEPKIAGIG